MALKNGTTVHNVNINFAGDYRGNDRTHRNLNMTNSFGDI